jgi:hypothetical protein
MARVRGNLSCGSSSSTKLDLTGEGRRIETPLAARRWLPRWFFHSRSIPPYSGRNIRAERPKKRFATAWRPVANVIRRKQALSLRITNIDNKF